MDWNGEITEKTIISTTVGKNALEEIKWSRSQSQQKSPKCSTWMQSKKWLNDLCWFPRQTIQYHTNSSLCPNQQCWRSWNWMVLWKPTRPSRTNTLKRYPFHYRELEWKSRKSRDTWFNRQNWHWSTEWSRAKVNRIMSREHTGHKKTPSSNNTREDSTHEHGQIDGQYWNQIDYILCSQRQALYISQQT